MLILGRRTCLNFRSAVHQYMPFRRQVREICFPSSSLVAIMTMLSFNIDTGMSCYSMQRDRPLNFMFRLS